MKLKQLRIDGFGKLTNQVISIDEKNQLLFGENEAGKSSIYHFIRTILFGFPKKREMVRDFTPITGAVYGGKIIFIEETYGEVTVERFKDRNKAQAQVRLANGEVKNEMFLERLIAPLTKETFDAVFSFQKEQLIELDQMNEVKLQHLLLAVGLTGSRKLSKMSDDFLKGRQRLFKPNGRVPEINQKLHQLNKIDEQIAIVEGQEAQYQAKKKKMRELQKEIETSENQKNKHLLEEKDVLEQQKRFPVYVEWESVSKEFTGDEPLASEEQIEKVTQALKNYEFLIGKEKELLESQQVNLKAESPAFQFYLENQSLFDDLLDEQLSVEGLSERRNLLEKQLSEYRESKKTLFNKYHLSEKVTQINLSDEAEKEMNQLAKEEEELIRQKVVLNNEKSRLNIRHKDLDVALSDAEHHLAPSEKTASNNRQTSSASDFNKKMFSGLSIAVAILFLILAFSINVTWIYLPTILLFGLGIYGFMSTNKRGKKQQPLSKESAKEDYLMQLTLADEVNHSLNAIEKSLTELNDKERVLQQKKETLSEKYGFSMKDTMSIWLSRVPIYLQLQTIEEKESEMLVNLKEIDRVLNAYKESLGFAKQWIPLTDKSIQASFKEVKKFVSEQEMNLKNKAMSLNNQDTFHKQLHHLKKEIKKTKDQLLSLINQVSIKEIEDVKIWLKKQALSEETKRKKEQLTHALEDYFDLDKEYKLIDINHHLLRTKAKIDDYRDKINHLQNEYQGLKYEALQMEKNGSLDVLYQEKENRLSKIKELSDQWMTYKLAEELTQDIFQYLSDQQLPALLATATSYFSLLTEGAYTKVFIRESNLLVLDRNNHSWPIIQLSTGTKDQLYIAFRLAFVHLHHEDYDAPFIIDDGWLHFDTQRKLVLFKLLKGFSQRTQVICLSSDQAIKTYYESQDLAYTLIGEEESK